MVSEDPFGRLSRMGPVAPLHNAEVLGPDGRPLSARTPALSRRTFVKAGAAVAASVKTGAAATACNIALCTVSAFLTKRGVSVTEEQLALARDQDRTTRQLTRNSRDVLATVFPSWAKNRSEVRFHPNGDNQRLLAQGIGAAHTSPADHLLESGVPLDVEFDGDLFAGADRAHRLEVPDLAVYSYTTLRQAYALHAAVMGQPGSDPTATSYAHDAVRRGFDTRFPNVVIGSPTGNRFAAALRGMWRRRDPGCEREMVYEGVEGLHVPPEHGRATSTDREEAFYLPFEFSLNRQKDASIYDVTTGKYTWGIHARPASPSDRRTPHVPLGRELCFFTITVVPNFLSRGDFRHLPPVVLLEGCGALGTSGIRLLLEPSAVADRGVLTEIEQHLKPAKSPYWQALVRITGSEERENPLTVIDGGKERIATGIAIEDFEWVYPSDLLFTYRRLARNALVDAARQLRKRN